MIDADDIKPGASFVLINVCNHHVIDLVIGVTDQGCYIIRRFYGADEDSVEYQWHEIDKLLDSYNYLYDSDNQNARARPAVKL